MNNIMFKTTKKIGTQFAIASLSIVLASSAFAQSYDTAGTKDRSVASGSGHTAHATVAYNDSMASPVAIYVDFFTDLNYHYSGSNCLGEKVESSILYPTNYINPNLCDYTVTYNKISVVNNGATQQFYTSNMQKGTYIYPANTVNTGYIANLSNRKLYLPVQFVTDCSIKWSDNCIPNASFPKFTLTVN